MRAIVQRVKWARVLVGGETVGTIDVGLLVLLGVARGDGDTEADMLANKIIGLRIFEDENGKMSSSVADIGGACMVVSQFTLFADCRKGRRPFFGGAEEPARASELCDRFATVARGLGVEVATGRFGAMMQVELCNDGPVTIPLDSDELKAPRRG